VFKGVGLSAALLLVVAPAAIAHDIPSDVTVQVFVKPEGSKLPAIVRAPLQAMRDVDYPRRPDGRVDLPRADRALREAATVWLRDNLHIYENGAEVAQPQIGDARVSILSDRSFASYESALAHAAAPPLDPTTDLFWNDGLLDVRFDYAIQSERSAFALDTRFARLGVRTTTVVRFVMPDSSVRAFEYAGDPGLVTLDPRWFEAARRFVVAGFFHILDGTDHLLFLVCLVIPLRRIRSLVGVVTAFTLAHSVTLLSSAFGYAPTMLWFPPLVETAIAASIVYMALENIVLFSRAAGDVEPRARWIVAFAFGLVHGFGFSFALRETLQFAGSHLLTSLLSFNVGVELGQLLVLAVLVPALALLFRYGVLERVGAILISALVAHTGWHWMIDRWERLRQYNIEWPAITPELLLVFVRWAMAIVALAAAGWLWSVVRGRARARLPLASQPDAASGSRQ